jgi:hypothetical protein
MPTRHPPASNSAAGRKTSCVTKPPAQNRDLSHERKRVGPGLGLNPLSQVNQNAQTAEAVAVCIA